MNLKEILIERGFSAPTMVPVKGDALERGDVVYEPIRWGQGPDQVKYKKYFVLTVLRGAVRVQDEERRDQPKKIRFADLRMERAPAPVVTLASRALPPPPAPPSPSLPPPTSPKPADDYQALLDMSRAVVDGLAKEQRDLIEEKATIQRSADTLAANHRKRIEALEGELARAHREHDADRALTQARIDAVNAKMVHADERRKALETLLKVTR